MYSILTLLWNLVSGLELALGQLSELSKRIDWAENASPSSLRVNHVLEQRQRTTRLDLEAVALIAACNVCVGQGTSLPRFVLG